MTKTLQFVQQEPVALQGLVQALLGLLVIFHAVDWSGQQTGAILTLSAAILSVFARSQVTPIVNPKDSSGASLAAKGASLPSGAVV